MKFIHLLPLIVTLSFLFHPASTSSCEEEDVAQHNYCVGKFPKNSMGFQECMGPYRCPIFMWKLRRTPMERGDVLRKYRVYGRSYRPYK